MSLPTALASCLVKLFDGSGFSVFIFIEEFAVRLEFCVVLFSRLANPDVGKLDKPIFGGCAEHIAWILFTILSFPPCAYFAWDQSAVAGKVIGGWESSDIDTPSNNSCCDAWAYAWQIKHGAPLGLLDLCLYVVTILLNPGRIFVNPSIQSSWGILRFSAADFMFFILVPKTKA